MVVHDGDELAREWLDLLEDTDKRAKVGVAARQAVRMRAKALDRTLDLLDRQVLDLVDRWILDSGRPGAERLDRFKSAPFFTRLLDPDERSPAIRFVRCALLPLSLLFGILVRSRNWMYDTGLLGSERLPVPVISVGALTVGGAGKTPVVRYLAGRLRNAGYRPAVLSRGYGRKTGAMRRAASGATWQEVGDEPAFLAAMLPDVPMIVGTNRTAAGRVAVDQYDANVLLLDDGFQHRRIGRKVDIVVHDASVRSNHGRLLPAGPYREPLSSLRRAHALVLTRTDQTLSHRIRPGAHSGPFRQSVRGAHPDLFRGGRHGAHQRRVPPSGPDRNRLRTRGSETAGRRYGPAIGLAGRPRGARPLRDRQSGFLRGNGHGRRRPREPGPGLPGSPPFHIPEPGPGYVLGARNGRGLDRHHGKGRCPGPGARHQRPPGRSGHHAPVDLG